MKVAIKRVYEEPKESDGTRILVDRLWPRGLTKEKARVDIWLKDIAPSNELRKWFAHDAKKWKEFQARYKDELKSNAAQLAVLKQEAEKGPVSLLFGAKDIATQRSGGSAEADRLEVNFPIPALAKPGHGVPRSKMKSGRDPRVRIEAAGLLAVVAH